MISSVKLESYQIPRFYQLLEEYGVVPAPTTSDFEAYRGHLDGSLITIQVNGMVQHADDRKVQNLIDLVMESLLDDPPEQTSAQEARQSSYMILAKPSRPSKFNYPINHLNIWLSSTQFEHAISLLGEVEEIVQHEPNHDFETTRFTLGSQTLRFHHNGKVIADDGYSRFAPYLTKAIEAHLPFSDYDLVIGQDEVGSGEKIGPLITSAVGATPKQLVDLQLVGVKDSKMVPSGISTIMAQWIRDIAAVSVVNQLNPMEFNQKRIEGQSSITEILTAQHNQTVHQVMDRIKQQGTEYGRMIYLVDAYDKYEQLSAFEEYSHLDIDVQYLAHAEEESMGVAAASLLAKAARVRWMRLYEKTYEIRLKRKHVNKIRQHERSHQLLKSL